MWKARKQEMIVVGVPIFNPPVALPTTMNRVAKAFHGGQHDLRPARDAKAAGSRKMR
jgi:hypothetical protein